MWCFGFVRLPPAKVPRECTDALQVPDSFSHSWLCTPGLLWTVPKVIWNLVLCSKPLPAGTVSPNSVSPSLCDCPCDGRTISWHCSNTRFRALTVYCSPFLEGRVDTGARLRGCTIPGLQGIFGFAPGRGRTPELVLTGTACKGTSRRGWGSIILARHGMCGWKHGRSS